MEALLVLLAALAALIAVDLIVDRLERDTPRPLRAHTARSLPSTHLPERQLEPTMHSFYTLIAMDLANERSLRGAAPA